MEKEQVLVAILLVSLLLIFLVGFMFLMLFLQKKKSNRFINERENMRRIFDEQLMKSQLEMQEQSFNAISMKIHDNVGQTLSLLKMQLNIMNEKAGNADPLLNEARFTATKAMADLRDIAKSFSTEKINSVSLRDMIGYEIKRINNIRVIKAALRITGDVKELISGRKLIIFRMLQECLQNVIKHANATSVFIRIRYDADHLIIEITDDGVGFDVGKIEGDTGMGLNNIYKRSEILGGKAEINSSAKKGTKIKIIIPYDQ